MKILIWVLTFIISTIINTLIGYITGIRMGSVLLYAIEFFVAKELCNKWDEHLANKAWREEHMNDFDNTVQSITSVFKDEESVLTEQTPNTIIHNNVQKDIVSQKSKLTEKIVIDSSPTENTVVETKLAQPQIAFCRKCGSKLLENSKFCGKCGTAVTLSN